MDSSPQMSPKESPFGSFVPADHVYSPTLPLPNNPTWTHTTFAPDAEVCIAMRPDTAEAQIPRTNNARTAPQHRFISVLLPFACSF
jgi:hypothetical protein